MDFLKTIMPWVGAAVTGGVPALIAAAANTVASTLGIEVEPTQEGVEFAVQNATPEQLIALRAADNDFKLKMQQAGFTHEEELAKVGLQEFQTEVADKQSARQTFGQNQAVFRLGVVILLTFALVTGSSLYGAYQILTGGIPALDAGVVAAVSTFVGAVLGYVAANAQQVTGYFFGSSAGSKEKTDAMAGAFKGIVK